MKIYLNDLSDLETKLEFDQTEKWVLDSVSSVDELFDEKLGERPALKATAKKPRSVEVSFNLSKVDDMAVVSGHIDTTVNLICSRCIKNYGMECHPRFSALFCKDPVMAGVGHLGRPEHGGRGGESEELVPMGQNQGHARHAHDFSEDENAGTGFSRDLDITYISEDFIDLAEILKEQLQLLVPFQPLCTEDCKGMCSNCGTDLNIGRCACAKMAKSLAFAGLQNLKF